MEIAIQPYCPIKEFQPLNICGKIYVINYRNKLDQGIAITLSNIYIYVDTIARPFIYELER